MPVSDGLSTAMDAIPTLSEAHLACTVVLCILMQVLMSVDKGLDGAVTSHALMDVGYVPLTRPSEFENGQMPGL